MNGIAGGTTFTEGVPGGVRVVRAEAAAFVLSVSTRVSEEHIVRKGYNNKVGVVGDPCRGTHAVVEQRSGTGLSETHFSAFLVDVGTVNLIVMVGVEDG